MRTIQPKDLKKYASKAEKKENFRNEIFENLGIPHEVVFFLEISENAVPFATGRFGWMESA